ncbi:MAG: DNA polymerase III subunit chi [Parachlamydiaceae bacterium]
MASSPLATITFYRVKDNGAKIQFIYTKAEEAFKQEKRLLISVPNFQAAQYIDTLLWKFPQESFLPHIVSDTPTSEWIAITMEGKQNVNQATCLLNLCPTVTALTENVLEIYELYDESLPEKTALSEKKLQEYEKKGMVVKLAFA